MDVPDERTIATTSVEISIEKIVGQAALRRAWLLTELEERKPQFDTFVHDDLCNMNPTYKTNHPLAPDNCDRNCLHQWRMKHLRIE